MLYAMRFEVGCELASTVLAVVLAAMIAQDLAWSSSVGEAGLQCVEDSRGGCVSCEVCSYQVA